MKDLGFLEVAPDVMDDFFKKAENPIVIPERITLPSGRWYRVGTELQKSVTTMLNVISSGNFMNEYYGNAPSYEFVKKKMKAKQDIGSHTHTHIAKLELGMTLNPADIPEEEIRFVFSFVQFWEYHSRIKPIRVRFVECPFWGGELWPFSGTLDAILDIWDEKKGKYITVLIDWKTGSVWTTYKYQLPCYKRLVMANIPGCEIDEMWDVYLKNYKGNGIPEVTDKPKFKVEKIKDISDEKILLINELWEENVDIKPKRPCNYGESIFIKPQLIIAQNQEALDAKNEEMTDDTEITINMEEQ